MRTYSTDFNIESKAGVTPRTFEVGSVAGARFTARDVDGLRQQMDEQLAKEGHFSSATHTNPSIFRITRYLLTQDTEFEVQGTMTGGEGEVVAIRDGEDIFISAGSDQCDRELDPIFPDKPKQMCPHPVATTAWPYAEVRDHWDELRIQSTVTVQGHAVPLQDSRLEALVTLDYLLDMPSVRSLPDVAFLYCGSSPFLDSAEEAVKEHNLSPFTTWGVGDAFSVRLYDPVLERSIEHDFVPVPVGDDLAERQSADRALPNFPMMD